MSSHGTRSCYVKGCRRNECRRAHATYVAIWKSRLPPLGADDERHGTTNGYSNYGCRCGSCTEANAVKTRARRVRERRTA